MGSRLHFPLGDVHVSFPLLLHYLHVEKVKLPVTGGLNTKTFGWLTTPVHGENVVKVLGCRVYGLGPIETVAILPHRV